MFVFAIETNGKTVAFTMEVDRVMLDGILTGGRDEGQQLRDGLLWMRDRDGPLWDGASPFTARLATSEEESEYDDIAVQRDNANLNVDSLIIFSAINLRGETCLLMPPSFAAA